MRKNKLQRFQEDLKAGMGLEEALQKYGFSLEYAFTHMPKPLHKKKKGVNPAFVSPLDDKYIIRKTVNGATTHFGTYKSQSDAVKVRDQCERYGWIKDNLDEYCREVGVERIRKKKE